MVYLHFLLPINEYYFYILCSNTINKDENLPRLEDRTYITILLQYLGQFKCAAFATYIEPRRK